MKNTITCEFQTLDRAIAESITSALTEFQPETAKGKKTVPEHLFSQLVCLEVRARLLGWSGNGGMSGKDILAM